MTAEVEPPKGIDASTAVDGARRLKALGIDAVNVTDNPMARLRMSSIAVAHMIKTETGTETIFHVSPRDRNVLGIQSDLLGAAGLGIKALLVVGGDPLKIGDYPQAKPVGEIDTLGLLRIVKGLNGGVDLAGGAIGSVDLVRDRLRGEPAPRRTSRSRSRSSSPRSTPAPPSPRRSRSTTWRRSTASSRAPEARAIPVLVGLIPPKSLKQALYFANEVPGMVVPESIIERMRKAAEKGPEFEAEEGIAIAVELAKAIAERARGVHIMPMARYEAVGRLLEVVAGRRRAAR